MKLIFSLILVIFFSTKSYSQNSINIIASGSAFTKEKAIFSALRNALEKGSGVYISSKTIIQNDQLVFDEVASLANGTISKYDIIESSFSEKFKEHQVTISATIEVGKFVNLIKSKGVNVAFEGASFAQNVKLNEYYKNEEPKILFNFLNNFSGNNALKLVDKKLLADGFKIFKFNPSSFPLQLDENWQSFSDDNLITKVRNGRDVIFEINKIKYLNPYHLKYLSPKFSYDGEYFSDKQDSISHVSNSWIEFYNNREKWTSDEIKNYSNLTEEKVNDIFKRNLYAKYKLLDSMNKRIFELQNQLRNKNGQYVINLVPEIKSNANYNTFIESFIKILQEISLNKDPSFSKLSYEEKFGETFSIFIYEYSNEFYKKREFIIRNPESVSMVNYFKQKFIQDLFSGKVIIEYNIIRSNIGIITNYLAGINSEINKNDHFQLNEKNSGFILNPKENEVPIAFSKNDQTIELITVPKYSLSHFADLETVKKIKEFTIENPPLKYYLPTRPNYFLVDNIKQFNTIQKKTLQEKLNTFASKTGAELFIVLDNNNYGIDNLKDLTAQYGSEWEIGGKERKGVILLINNKTRKIFYNYGEGLDSQLTNKDASEIIKSFQPLLKAGNYLGAFMKAIDLTEAKILPIKK